jgi:hypothetical protein
LFYYHVIIVLSLLLPIYKVKNQIHAALRKIERERRKEEPSSPFLKRILIVDDDPDITLTFKIGLEDDKII